MEDSFSTDGERGDGFGMIQARDVLMPLLNGWEAELRCECEQRGAAVNTVRLPRWLLTSCSATWFLTGHGRVPACGPGLLGLLV